MLLKSIKENKDNYLYWGYLIIIGIIFYIMNCYTPLFCDDFHYCHKYGTTIPIESIGDILKSQYIHYFEMNGRFTPHFFVQLFAGILGKSIFNIFNTFVFICFFHLLIITIKPNNNNKHHILSIAIFLIFLLLPDFGTCFLWMSGACNYLWTGVFLLFFNYLIQQKIKNKKLYSLLIFYGVLSGWTHEGLVIGLICGYTLYFIIYPKELTASRKILIIGFYIGAFLLIFSPGSINRFLGTISNETSLTSKLYDYLMAIIGMCNIRIFPLFGIILLILNRHNKYQIKGFLHNNIVWLCAILALFPFIIATKFPQGSSRFGLELFSLILTLKLINHIQLNKYYYLTTSLKITTIVILTYAILLCSDNYSDYKSQITQINNGNNLILTNSNYHPNEFWYRFLVKHKHSEYEGDVYFKEEYFFHRYFVKRNITYCPKSIYYAIIENPNNFNFYQSHLNLPFYIKCIDNIDKVNQVVFILNKTNLNDLPFYIRPFASYFSRYTIDSLETPWYDIIEYNNKKYIIIAKNQAIDFRLNDIQIR